MVELTCDYCGDSYSVRPSKAERSRFCSKKCCYDWRGENNSGSDNPNHKPKKSVECKYCGQIYKVQPHRAETTKYCSKDCQLSDYNKNNEGENHPMYKGKITLECEYCKKEFEAYPNRKGKQRFCSFECTGNWRSETIKGEKHPNWTDDANREFNYGSNWDRMRKKTLERDDYKCIVCKQGKDELGQHPDVHHIKPLNEFDKPEDANFLDNLISLCRKHHKMIEGWGLKPSNINF